MKKKLLRAAAAALMLLCGCTPVNESEGAGSAGETVVYIAPSHTSAYYADNAGDAPAGTDAGSGSPAAYSGFGGKYVYFSLSEEEKKEYDILLEAARNFFPAAVFTRPLSADELRKIFTAVYTQESRVFWLDSRYYSAEENPSLNLFYRYGEEEAEEMRAMLDISAGDIIGSLPAGCTAYEAVKHFHDSIILGCDFSKDGEYVHTAYGALVDGTAQCEGYAFAMSYLCNMAGIDNYVVSGSNSEGASHAWNKVCVDGAWYNVDCTWDDPLLKRESPDFVRHDYLFVPDRDMIGITHFPDDSYVSHIPCESDELNYFIAEGLCFSDAKSGISAMEKQLYLAAVSGKTEAEIRFDSYDEYRNAYEELFSSDGIKTVIEGLNGSYGFRIKNASHVKNDAMNIIHISLIFKD